MLVLSRKVGEKLNIGEDVEVHVARVAGNRVTLAISAPQQVRIVRGELKSLPMQQPTADQPPQHKAA